MEISRTDRRRQNETRRKISSKSGSASKTTGSFGLELSNSINVTFSGTIDELLNDLDKESKRFLDSQSLYDLMRYKSLVQKILRTILSEGFEVKNKKTIRTKKELTIAEVIDEKLLAITAAITKHDRAFSLMKTIEEIRGLLCDLVY